MRILTYNVHSCVGTDGRAAPERIAEVIAELAPDVVCLQELDLDRAKTGRTDQARRIAERLGMAFEFHPTISRATEHYGDAILSPHPLRLQRAAAFPPVPWPIPRELRGAICAEITLGGVPWRVINTHLGLGREERRLQAGWLVRDWIHAAPPERLVVCGDLNSRSGSAVHRILESVVRDAWRALGRPHESTFSTRLPFVCLDYVFLSPDVSVESARVVRTPLARVASDHFPVLVEVRAPA